MNTIEGKIWKYGNNIDTDVILPARYLIYSEPEKLAPHCLEDIDEDFVNKAKQGDIIVAGDNFGCGSSREHAPLAIKAVGISCVVAISFARIFFRNAINIGLPVFEAEPIFLEEINTGDKIIVDIKNKTIINKANNKKYKISSFPKFILNIIDSGGLIEHVKNK